MSDRELTPQTEKEASVISTERLKTRGGQVVRVLVATPSGGVERVEVPVGSLNLPSLYEDH